MNYWALNVESFLCLKFCKISRLQNSLTTQNPLVMVYIMLLKAWLIVYALGSMLWIVLRGVHLLQEVLEKLLSPVQWRNHFCLCPFWKNFPVYPSWSPRWDCLEGVCMYHGLVRGQTAHIKFVRHILLSNFKCLMFLLYSISGVSITSQKTQRQTEAKLAVRSLSHKGVVNAQ